jgi:DNA polymerase III subunit gamma/tau
MESYVVSARKYRPTGFGEVVGQEHITTTLNNAIKQNQLAQALLFCGPRGVGKTTCARILARLVNNFEQEEAPLNIYELDAASNNSVEDIRNLIDQVRYPPQQGKYKVYIIDEVHMLSNQAFNAFLKTLEEPPPYAIFILATTEKHKVIPTILSRCQIYDFNRIQLSDIVQHLQKIARNEGVTTEEDALLLIAQKADGALRDALSLFDLQVTFSTDNSVTYANTIRNLHILDYDYYFRVTESLHAQDRSQVFLVFDEIIQQGFDGRNFIIGLSEHFRNLLVCKDPATVQLMEGSEQVKQRYLEQSRQTETGFLLTALNIANQCDLHYKQSKNQRLHVEVYLMKIAHINAAIRMVEQGFSAEEGKKKAPPVKEEADPLKEEVKRVQINRLKPTTRLPNKDQLLQKQVASPAGKLETQAAVAEKEVKSDTVQPSQPEDAPINRDALQKAWASYARKRKEAGKLYEYTLLNQPVELLEDGITIELTINNPLDQDVLTDVRADLMSYLRTALQNQQLSLTTALRKEERKRKLYTAEEKFKHLAEKNPLLHELKDRLGLDTEF